jgi:hypothetical protein
MVLDFPLSPWTLPPTLYRIPNCSGAISWVDCDSPSECCLMQCLQYSCSQPYWGRVFPCLPAPPGVSPRFDRQRTLSAGQFKVSSESWGVSYCFGNFAAHRFVLFDRSNWKHPSKIVLWCSDALGCLWSYASYYWIVRDSLTFTCWWRLTGMSQPTLSSLSRRARPWWASWAYWKAGSPVGWSPSWGWTRGMH